jgi:hypothetical protein
MTSPLNDSEPINECAEEQALKSYSEMIAHVGPTEQRVLAQAYRPLEVGEIIEKGDEVLVHDGWRPFVRCAFGQRLDPGITPARRPVGKPVAVPFSPVGAVGPVGSSEFFLASGKPLYGVGIGGAPTRASTLPEDPKERKKYPVASGLMDYFPDALAAVANVSYVGNEQHNPGQPLNWARGKSSDEADTMLRHFLQRGSLDKDGTRHTAKMVWRALALLQKEIEAEGK